MATGNAADQTYQFLDGLSEPTRTRAYILVWVLRTYGYPVVITSGRRTATEQAALVRAGRSRTLRSKHVTGQAFDVDWFRTAREDVPKAFWQLIGPWAESELGLTWGGRWRHPYDPGHFES